MPTHTIRQAGGDFSTLASALADAGVVASDILSIEESWTVDDTDAATAADNNLLVQTDNDSYHFGVFDTSNNHYRLVVSGAHCLTINNTGCTIDGLAIQQSGTGVSDEAIRMAAAGGTLNVLGGLLWASTATSDQDGIYAGSISCTVNTENLILYGWGRAGLHPQITGGVHTHTWNNNCVTAWNCETISDDDGGGISLNMDPAGATYFINCFNCSFAGAAATGTSEDYNERNVGGTSTWNIDDSIDSDGSITARDAGAVGALENRTATDNISPGVGDFVIYEDITTNINLLLQNNAVDNDAQEAHSNTTGAGMTLPVLDIEKTPRNRAPGEIDIGADAFPPGAKSQVLIFG